MANPFSILGFGPGLFRGRTDDQIRKIVLAQLRLLKSIHHPDTKGGSTAAFQELLEVEEILQDEVEWAIYSEKLRSGRKGREEEFEELGEQVKELRRDRIATWLRLAASSPTAILNRARHMDGTFSSHVRPLEWLLGRRILLTNLPYDVRGRSAVYSVEQRGHPWRGLEVRFSSEGAEVHELRTEALTGNATLDEFYVNRSKVERNSYQYRRNGKSSFLPGVKPLATADELLVREAEIRRNLPSAGTVENSGYQVTTWEQIVPYLHVLRAEVTSHTQLFGSQVPAILKTRYLVRKNPGKEPPQFDHLDELDLPKIFIFGTIWRIEE